MTNRKNQKHILHVELIPTFRANILPLHGIKYDDENIRYDYLHGNDDDNSWIDVDASSPFEVPHYYYGVIHNATHHYQMMAEFEGRPHYKLIGDDIILYPAEYWFDGDCITIVDEGPIKD